MRRIRFLVLGAIGFLITTLGAFFAPGNWLNRVLAVSLCTVMGADSTICVAKLAESSHRAVAATPPGIERLIADRSTEFDDVPESPPASNQQAPAFPFDPGQNIIRPDFDGSDTNTNNRRNIRTDIANNNSLTEISPGLYETFFINSEGCQITRHIRKTGSQVYYESIEYKPSTPDSCGGKHYNFTFEDGGNRIIAENENKEIFDLTFVNETEVEIKYTDTEKVEWLIEAEKIHGASNYHSGNTSNQGKACSSKRKNLKTEKKQATLTPVKTNQNNFLIADAGDAFVYDMNCNICTDMAPKLFDAFDAANNYDTALGVGQLAGNSSLKITNAIKIRDPKLGDYALDIVADATFTAIFSVKMNQYWKDVKTGTLGALDCGRSGYDPCQKLAAENAARDVVEAGDASPNQTGATSPNQTGATSPNRTGANTNPEPTPPPPPAPPACSQTAKTCIYSTGIRSPLEGRYLGRMGGFRAACDASDDEVYQVIEQQISPQQLAAVSGSLGIDHCVPDITITAFYCEGQPSESCTVGWGETINLIIEYTATGENPINWQVAGYSIGDSAAEGTVESPNGESSISHPLKCICESGDCNSTQDSPMTARLSTGQATPVTASLKLTCKPGAGQIIDNIIRDRVIPQIPIPSIPGLPF